MVVRLQIRHDIKSEWELYNPVLASGELGIETDNAEGQRIKIGDGNRAWIDLPFIDDKSVHKYADEEIYGNKIFHNSLLLRQGAEIPEGQILNGLADSASKDDEGNVIKDYYQPKIVVLDEITNETDWNTLIKEGIYKVSIDTWGTASTLHGPNGYINNIYSKGILCVHANQGFVTQVYYPYMESPIVYRNFNNVEWQTWGSISSLDRTIVHTTGDETIAGNKTFSNNVVLSNGNINFDLVGDALILKGGEPFIKKSTENDTYISASEGGSIHFRPNGDTSVEGEVVIDNQGIIQGKVTQDSAGNVISDTYARKDQMEEVANNEGLTATFLGRNLLDNPSGYTEVKEMYHSTFDKTKFSIVGNPTITKDGIASGFSDVNYIVGNHTNTTNATYYFQIKLREVQPSKATCIFKINNTNESTSKVLIYQTVTLSGVAISVSDKFSTPINLTLGNTYNFMLQITDTNITLTVYNEDLSLAGTTSIDITEPIQSHGFNIGLTSGYEPWDREFDLKSISVKTEGREILNGNKTGLDIIKADDFEKVGDITITNDGIVSGFSDSKYLTSGSRTFDFSKPWDIKGKITTVLSDNEQGILSINSYSWLRLTPSSVGHYFGFCINDGNEHRINGSYVYKNNTTYDFDFGWTGTEYYLKVYLNNILVETLTHTSSTAIKNSETLINISAIGNFEANLSNQFLGSVDLNSFKIYIDGDLVYQPCLRIPYNKTNAGVKISDIYYKDRIEDCYTYYNTANYFIIDEANKLYQIPYDTPSGHCVIIAQERDGINSYEYNTNLECIQTGSCTANTEFTFIIPYANDQYALSCPYSAKSRTGFTPTVTGDFISKGLIFLSDTQ